MFSSLFQTVGSFPNSIGTCDAGTDALLQPNAIVDLQTHGILNQVGTGPLSDFGLELKLDGQTLDPNTPTDFSTGEDHVLSLIATNGTDFTGFLLRMDSTDDAHTSTLGALQPDGSESGAKIPYQCQNIAQVAGVCQTDASKKTQVNLILNQEFPSVGLELDATVVIETSIQRNISQWYYSRYILNSVGSGPAPAPTQVPVQNDNPTMQPAAGNPTSSPNNNNQSSAALAHHSFLSVATLILISMLLTI